MIIPWGQIRRKYHEKTETENMDDIYRDNILRLGGRYKGTENSTKGAYGNGDRAGMDEENDIDRIITYCEKDTIAVAQILLKLRGDELLEEHEIIHII